MARRKRSLDAVEIPPWKFIAFTDLHVRSDNIEKCLAVLAEVRHLAKEREAEVVFVGDFWDARGQLSVRQLDVLLDEFQRWRDEGIALTLIPGNHDQVSVNGVVHGIRVFEPFPNITVATHTIEREAEKIAFLPWRQDPEEQGALFTDLDGDGWTIFAHAEVKGATTNQFHEAPGRVSRTIIETVARACYCGHYHKRQQLGDRTWYLGSPFQHTFTEMDDPPKGIAFITRDVLEPEWIELTGFPRHHRFKLPEEETSFEEVADHDIVELYVPKADIGTAELRQFVKDFPARDVRTLPLPEEEDTDASPAFALTLDDAIDAYVHEAAGNGVNLAQSDPTALGKLGRAILAEIPEALKVTPMAPEVRVLDVEAHNFCAIGDGIKLSLDKRGLMMLKGPIGVGKTALTDAVTWCLYGQTAPRKAGSHGSTLRGDEVIHDDADEVVVTVHLDVAGKDIQVTRTKVRGKGAKVAIMGTAVPDGIADQQDLINHIVGMTHSMWRTTVSLGQGAVGNFLTDADKARKELLSAAFGLEACPAALRYVRDRLKPLGMQIEKYTLDADADRRVLSELAKTDYTEQSKQWDEQRAVAQDTAQQAGIAAKAQVEECDRLLVEEAKWLETKAQHDTRVEALTKQLVGLGSGNALSKLERERGGIQSERSMIERDHAVAVDAAAKLEEALHKGPLPCPTCSKPMDAPVAEKHVVEKHKEAERLQRALRTFDAKLGNVAAKIDAVAKSGSSQREAVETQLADARAALSQVATALNQFVRLKTNKVNAEQRLAEARAAWERDAATQNPWLEKQAGLTQKLADLDQSIHEKDTAVQELADQSKALAFWAEGFSAKGLPVLVLRTALHELETYANRFMGQLLAGKVFCQLAMEGDDLKVLFSENIDGAVHERRYEQLSGGQRRCAELAFSPFALSEMVFNRCGVRVPLLVIDELTTHMGANEKPLVCEILRTLDRDTILVIDHDAAVQGQFDVVYEMSRSGGGVLIERAS